MKIQEIRDLTSDEIAVRIKEEQESLLRMKFNNAISEIENPTKIHMAKKTIARLLTVQKERELAANQEETANNEG